MDKGVIILPETKIIPPERNHVNLQMRLKGFSRCILRDKMGNVLQDTGWFPNMIMNRLMVSVRDGGFGGNVNWQYCELGSSATAPAATDVNVNSPIDGVRKLGTASVGFGGAGGTEYYYRRHVARFLEGESTGTIREMAWHQLSTGTAYCGIHSLIVDGGGTPTTIVKGADHILDVWHELRNYIPTGDTTGTISIAHDGVPTNFDYLARACRVGMTGSLQWYVLNREDISSVTTHSAVSSSEPVAITSDISPGAYLAGSGNAVTITNAGVGTASSTWWNECQIQAGLDSWLLGSGIRTLRFATGNCVWQVRYGRSSDDQRIIKTNEDRLRLKFKLSWGLYP